MEFGIEKCAIKIIKSGKRETMEGIELPNQERIRTLGEKLNYKYLGILELDTIKHGKNVYLKGTRKLLETKLCCRNHQRNKYLGILPCKRLWVILKMDMRRQIDQRTRKLMIIPKVLHSRYDRQTICVKKRGIGFFRCINTGTTLKIANKD